MNELGTDELGIAGCITLLVSNGYRVIRPLEQRSSYANRTKPEAGLVKVAIVDTETTGLDFWSDYMIEAAVLVVEFLPETGEVFDVIATYSGLEESPIGVPVEAAAVNGISESEIQGRRFDDERVAEVLAGVSLVIAHNAEFDRPFLEERFPVFATLPWACSQKGIWWQGEGMGGAKLEYLCYRAGYHYAAHRAINDCRALLELLATPLPKSGRSALQVLWDGAKESFFEVRFALPPRSDVIPQAKNFGARWNAKLKRWCIRSSNINLQPKLDNVTKLTQGLASVDSVRVIESSAIDRFSMRDGIDVTQRYFG
ncbi:3'-5' exonuclease [Niveibacterium sp.]|uniref:3'-5' exonuclease n=1 Tax=Niveibacterium sp. TaxID=2017444 RepID=UPI0035AEC642